MTCRSLVPALVALAFLFGAPLSARPAFVEGALRVEGAGPDATAELIAEIERARDEAEPEALARLAGHRSRAAAEGLIRIYDRMATIYMRREVVRALALLDGVADGEQLALQKLMDVATTSEEPELRDAAIEAFGRCPKLGKSFLERIVESPADDEVREHAMRVHVSIGDESDREWYAKLYEKEKSRSPKRDRRRKKPDDDAEELLVHRLASVRELAFDALRGKLATAALEEACDDSWTGIRRLALETLAEKDPKVAAKRARELLGDLEEHSATRSAAVHVLAAVEGTRASDELIKLADAFTTPMGVRLAIADVLAEMRDAKIDSALIRMLPRAKRTHEKLWLLRALRHVGDAKLHRQVERLLSDKDADVCIAAARLLGERREKDSLPELERLVERSKDPLLVAEALASISAIRAGDAKWIERLAELARSEHAEVRNAALLELGRTGDAQHFDSLAAALDHPLWSTRYAALQGLERLRTPAAVGRIVERMSNESGRMSIEFADVLFRLTGRPYRTAAASWKAWWEREKDEFQVISAAELEQRQREEEERRLRQVSGVRFFGIRVLSHRAIFVIDISGSMNEPMRDRYVGQPSGLTRMDVARRELIKCIDGLEPGALFNIVTFSSGVDRWLDGRITGATTKSREDAKAWVERLGAFDATNLYDAVKAAFDDPDVDTIFVLSDGEPNVGGETDPGMIRRHVQQWNERRGVVIHSISIGLQLEILRWLAEDSGGKYVQFF